MKVVLNVAEKPSVAKEIVRVLCNGTPNKYFHSSKFNPIYEFEYTIQGESVIMKVTSVQGHIMGMDFIEPYNKWNFASPDELFEAAIEKKITNDKLDIASTIKFAARGINMLALWLDCDREGENIAYEVIQVVTTEIRLNQSMIKRAQFSALTKRDIENAIQNLVYPRLEISEAVDARQEIDLRLGSIFTRMQTMRIQMYCPSINAKLISWGPCQFPTLGFVVERFLEIERFVSEKYWTIDMSVDRPGGKKAKFTWSRSRLFDFLVVLVLYESCIEAGVAKIFSINRHEKSKWRPVPLNTISLQKLASSKLKIDSSKAMNIAEKLYQDGLISYPRTETDFFKETINLRQLIEIQHPSAEWGQYAQSMAAGNFTWPQNGGHDDQSHPPIHPVKLASRQSLSDEEWKVYELITRHFLASCSLNAKGFETIVMAYMGGELFECRGLEVREMNFLNVYPYMKWNEADLPVFLENEEFEPTALMMEEHQTVPPKLLNESNLIALMDKSGIGTDATIHQHIKTIQDRNYVKKTPAGLFMPTPLGLSLVSGYAAIGSTLHKPELRAKMERSLNEIINKTKQKKEVIDSILVEMEDVYMFVKNKFNAICQIINEKAVADVVQPQVQGVCYKCGESGHFSNQCDREVRARSPINSEEQKVRCYKCGGAGHYANNCTAQTERSEATGKDAKISCYKCGKQGHYSNSCNANAGDRNKPTGKKCQKCGNIGRHPKGSECLKRGKNNANN